MSDGEITRKMLSEALGWELSVDEAITVEHLVFAKLSSEYKKLKADYDTLLSKMQIAQNEVFTIQTLMRQLTDRVAVLQNPVRLELIGKAMQGLISRSFKPCPTGNDHAKWAVVSLPSRTETAKAAIEFADAVLEEL